jgi:hypothetical protein
MVNSQGEETTKKQEGLESAPKWSVGNPLNSKWLHKLKIWGLSGWEGWLAPA